MAKDNAAILQKIRISGNLILKSPLLIGSGEHRENSMHEIDTYILRNQDDRPFIPGTSLAGVLRNAMMGADASDTEKTVGELLFGKIDKDKKSDTGWQSAISIDDLILDNAEIVQRDGVSIDSYTHTAIDKKKYDYEAVERGAKGTFQAVVSLRKNQEDRFEEIHDIRGYKMYWHKRGLAKWEIDSPDNKIEGMIPIRPLKQGNVFKGRIRFTDLSEVELGALLKVFALGANDDELYYKLGQGKSLGMFRNDGRTRRRRQHKNMVTSLM